MNQTNQYPHLYACLTEILKTAPLLQYVSRSHSKERRDGFIIQALPSIYTIGTHTFLQI